MPSTNKLQLYNRKKVKCTKCITRLIDRGQTSNGQWFLFYQKKNLKAYIPFWLLMECPNCGSLYMIEAEKGITDRYINSYSDKTRKKPDGSKGNNQQGTGDERSADECVVAEPEC